MLRYFYNNHTKLKGRHILYTAQWTTWANAAISAASADMVLEQAHIDAAVRTNPLLASATPELWRRAHETFLHHGVLTTSFLRIVTGNPALLARPPEKVIGALEVWRACQFGEKLLYLLLTKYPELLNVVDGHSLLTRIAYLKSFSTTNKNVWKLLMSCPTLLEEPEQQIEMKVQYLKEIMRLEVPEIVKSEALSKSLNELRCRHVFLERLGLFKPRSLKSNPDDPTKNPRLYQICDTSEKKFATKICHVTLAEFEAFKELFERELHRQREDDETWSYDESLD